MRLNYIPSPAGISGFGRLYNGYCIMDSRYIAPTGWHVPTLDNWMTLLTTLASSAGGKLKEVGNTHWLSPNTGATNEVSFGAVGSGARMEYYDFFRYKAECWLWSSTWEAGYNQSRVIMYNDALTGAGNLVYTSGGSLRLIKDNSTDPGTVTGNDGTVYPTVKIGDQVWMAENSRETKYRNGNDIPEIRDYAAWFGLTTGAWCYPNNNPSNL